ncbi:ABC transporter permease [Roseobacteraceae bacterium S113]
MAQPPSSSTAHSPDPAMTPSGAIRRSHASARTIVALVLREMSTRYGKSIGGYVWAVMEPLAATVLMAVGFSLLIRTPSLGTSFLLFYATGYLPFHLYQQISLVVARSIVFSKPLLFYPAVTWLDAVLARFILNALTGIMVCYITLVAVLLTLDTRAVLDVGYVILAMTSALALGLGIGVMNCAIMGLFPTWNQIWSIVTRPLFIASGVIFIYEDIPQLAQQVLWYNPLMHVTGMFRQGIYPMYEPQYISVVFVLGMAFVLTALGLLLLTRYHREILQRS